MVNARFSDPTSGLVCLARLLGALLALGLLSAAPRDDGGQPEEAIRLIVRADDMGTSHAANVACLRAWKEGIVRSVEVVVPGPWFPEAATLLRESPELDVGIHLTLTSEWDAVKWRPLTHAPSLVDADGYFYPMTSQRQGFPPGTGFLEAMPKPEEVEGELRAQIELARKRLPNVSHLSSHMGTPTATPELRAIVEKLSEEYRLPIEAGGLQSVPAFRAKASPEEKAKQLAAALEKIGPGTWVLVDHPGMDTPEMRAIGHIGYRDVALDREGVTRAFTAPEVKEVVAKRKIQLVSYADIRDR